MMNINLVKDSNMKEIHFYTNLTNEEQTSEWDLDTMCVDYYTSNEAIEDLNVTMVKTTQLGLLRNTWDYINRGDMVFIHNGSEIIKIEPNMFYKGKYIKPGHDLSRMLIGGTFGEIC